MHELRLVGVSDDGERIVLTGIDGKQFTVLLDERLRAAVRVDRTRLGQLELEMDGQPRPRDIQAAIRAGGSVQDVAEAFGVGVDRVERFARPVLGERVHVTETARATAARRGADAAAPQLGALVTERLEARGVEPTTMEWDAWRRDDGRWTIRLDYVTSGRPRHAEWQYDAAGRYLLPDDDEARWLVAEDPRDQVIPFGRRRDQSLEVAPPVEDAGVDDDAEAEVAESQHDTLPIHRDEPAPTPATVEDQAVDEDAEAPAAKVPAKKRGRASVPSWDDIVFGSRRSSD